MPAKYRAKQYLEGGFYHVFNRGVERRKIFLDERDYTVFLHLIKYYLTGEDKDKKNPLSDFVDLAPKRPRPLNSLRDEVELHCYCLMPNHFHLLIRQKSKDGMQKLFQKLLTNYSMYFNRKYDRVGHLFQGRYRASIVETDEYLLHLSRYIHQNPSLTKGYLSQYPYSSYPYYIGEKKSDWLHTDFVLSFFEPAKRADLNINQFSNYKEFVEGYEEEPEKIIGKLAID